MTRTGLRVGTALVIGAMLFATDRLLEGSNLSSFTRMWGPLAVALVGGALTVWLLQPARRK